MASSLARGGADASPPDNREFRLSEKAFRAIAETIYAHAGIVLDTSKKELVYARLARRLRKLSFPDFSSYLDFVNSDDGQEERTNLINALTTNHTKFFREDHHFDFLRSTIIPYWKTRARQTGNKRLRIWSSASSSGEEPYTLAMVLGAELDDSWNWKILATDIDTNVLDIGRQGLYPSELLRDIPRDYQRKFITSQTVSTFNISPALQSRVVFNRLNLHGPWPIKGKFDVIFCRNVIIYFDAPSKEKLLQRFRASLTPDSWFFLGHSESVLDRQAGFQLVGRTIYRLSETGGGK